AVVPFLKWPGRAPHSKQVMALVFAPWALKFYCGSLFVNESLQPIKDDSLDV
ncbi:hypothetical protein Tco_0444307, partial [Tanacetum coccineum]